MDIQHVSDEDFAGQNRIQFNCFFGVSSGPQASSAQVCIRILLCLDSSRPFSAVLIRRAPYILSRIRVYDIAYYIIYAVLYSTEHHCWVHWANILNAWCTFATVFWTRDIEEVLASTPLFRFVWKTCFEMVANKKLTPKIKIQNKNKQLLEIIDYFASIYPHLHS